MKTSQTEDAIALLIGGKSSDGASKELKSFARDILDAVRNKDADALAAALKGAVTACMDCDDSKESDTEVDEE